MWIPNPQSPGYFYNQATGQHAHGSQLPPGALPPQGQPQQPQFQPQAQPTQQPAQQGYGYGPPQPHPHQMPQQAQPQYAPPQQQYAPPAQQYAQQPQYGAPPAQQFGQPQAQQPKQMPHFHEATDNKLPQTQYAKNFTDTPWIDFPKTKEMTIGQKVDLLVRFLPALEDSDRFVQLVEHQLPIEFEALANPTMERRQNDKRKSFNVLCSDFGARAPGGCSVCAVRQNLQGATLQAFKARFWTRKRARHYGLNLSKPDVHWIQKKDQNGQPVMGPDGQPVWDVVPGIVVLGAELYTAVTNRAINAGGPIDSLARGIVMQLSKTRTGSGDMDVSYDADRGQEYPLMGTPWEPVLHHIDSLRTRFEKYRAPEEMVKYAELIRQSLGIGSTTMHSVPQQQTPWGQPAPAQFGGAAAATPAPQSFGPGMPPGTQPQGGFGMPGIPQMQQAPQGQPQQPAQQFGGPPQGAPPMGPPAGYGAPPAQSFQPTAPQAVPLSAMPPVQPFGGYLTAPGLGTQPPQAHGGPPPQQAPQQPAQQFQPPQPQQFQQPQGPQYPGGLPPQPTQQYAMPQPQYLPQQPAQGAPQGGPAPAGGQPPFPGYVSPEELERAMKPSGGGIPF